MNPSEKPKTVKESLDNLSPLERKVYDNLISRHDEAAINIEDFRDLYGNTNVNSDAAVVARKEADPDFEKPSLRSRLFEALITEQIELSDWFGPEAATIVPSRFDDYEHGVDIAVEFEGDEGFKHLALGIDITSSEARLAKKLRVIKRHIASGTLTKIKYFQSDKSNIRGEIREIPQLLVGASTKLIQELCELWATAHNYKLHSAEGLSQESLDSQREAAIKAQKGLARHRARGLILHQAILQLDVYAKFALQCGKPEIEAKFKSIRAVLKDINSKADTEQSATAELENLKDPVSEALESLLRQFDTL